MRHKIAEDKKAYDAQAREWQTELEILRRLRDVAPEQRMMQLMARRMMARQAAQGASKEGKRTAKANL